MKIRSTAAAALFLASAFPQTVYAEAPPGQPYIQIPIPGIPGVAPPPRRDERDYDRERLAHCERLRIENTSFATGWPVRRPTAKSEEDLSIGFAKCVTRENSAGIVKNTTKVISSLGRRQ